MKFSILVGCYGDFSSYSLRCVRSIIEYTEGDYDLIVGCNACCDETTQWLQEQYNEGRIQSLVLLRNNINKCPMMRRLLQLVETEYFVWFDDDSHVTAKGWDRHLVPFLEREQPDVAGHVYFVHRENHEGYTDFAKERPWFVNPRFKDPENRIWFATGGLYAMRTEFLKYHNYPDPGMLILYEDILLGELVEQHNGKLSQFPGELMDAIHINEGERRGDWDTPEEIGTERSGV